MKFLNNVDLNKNQIVAVRIHNSSSDPQATTDADYGMIYYNTTSSVMKFWDGKGWEIVSTSSSDKYPTLMEMVRGTWSNGTFTPDSSNGTSWALRLTLSDNSFLYAKTDGGSLHLSADYTTTGIGSATPSQGDTIDAAIAKLSNKIQEIVSQGGGEVNVIDDVKVNGSSLTVTNKAVDILIQSCSNEAGHNGDLKVNGAYVNVANLSNYSTLQAGDFLSHGLITGNGVTADWVVTHSLNCQYPSVTIYDHKTHELVVTDVTADDPDYVTIRFAVAPSATEQYDVFVVGNSHASTATVTQAQQIVDNGN